MKKKTQGSGLKGVGGVWKSRKRPCMEAKAAIVERFKQEKDIAWRVLTINIKNFGAYSPEAARSGERYDRKMAAFARHRDEYSNMLVNANRAWQARQARD